MKIYIYNEEGYYAGSLEAQKDPRETAKGNGSEADDKWIMPPNATRVKPKKADEGYRMRWDGTEWLEELIPVPDPEPEIEVTPEMLEMWRIERLITAEVRAMAIERLIARDELPVGSV